MRGSIWPFQFGSPRDIKLPEAKTTKDQTIQKRTEPAFIEPMQCKPVTALPAGEKWTFEIKFDGYRCIAVKRARDIMLFSIEQPQWQQLDDFINRIMTSSSTSPKSLRCLPLLIRQPDLSDWYDVHPTVIPKAEVIRESRRGSCDTRREHTIRPTASSLGDG